MGRSCKKGSVMIPLIQPFPTVEQWRRDEPDGAMPKCPSCGWRLGIRLAVWNASGRDEWICDINACNGNGQ